MKTIASIFIAILIVASCFFVAKTTANQSQKPNRPQLTQADIDRWMTELSNWGRWGKQDELGAINLITQAKRKQAAALVRAGLTVSLSHDTNVESAPDNSNPYTHQMMMTGETDGGQWSVDTIGVLFHGYQHTHLDALCHMFWQGKMYNGFSQTEVTRKGANKLSILNLKQGIVTRGILIDVPRLKGVAYLEPGTAIYPEDLDAWEKKAKLKIAPGDVIFIRTGRWARRAAKGPWDIGNNSAGLHASCAKWIKQRDVAILGSDAASDLLPSGIEGVTHPIHQLTLVAMGVHILDNCDLEALSETCAKLNRWDFMLTASPIAVTGGTGSPLNPIAVF